MIVNQSASVLPKLRFLEFQDTSQWNKQPLGHLAHVVAGQSPKGENYNASGTGTPFYQGKADFCEMYLKPPKKWTTQTTKLAQSGDILMSVRAPVGALNLSTERICIGRGLASIQPSNCSKWFLYYSLFGQQSRIIGNGGSVFDSINKAQVEKLLILTPPTRAEQLKIADCLVSLDDLIAAESRKLGALREHKQGLMQQLFPQPGENVPRLRFAEFNDLPEWHLQTLSAASEVNPSNEGLPVQFIYIDLESVKSNLLSERKEISRNAAPSRAQRLLRPKDIIYQTVRPYQRNNLFFDTNDGCKYVASTGYAQLRAKESPEFLYQLIHTDSFVSSVLARCTGSNYPAINPSALASIEVLLPRKTEQQKIADFLGSLDNIIAEKTRKIKVLRQHKQGLLQQIFPIMENH